jgi:hypothetical protein
MIYLGFQKTVRMKAEAVAWDVIVEPRGIVRRGAREEALPWQSVGRILLRAFPGHPHVVCGVTLTDGSEWAFGIPDHATAEAVASLAAAGVARLRLFDVNLAAVQALTSRIATHYPGITVEPNNRDPAGMDLAVNATPLGMDAGDPLPMDTTRLDARTVVGEVVMRAETTAFLAAAQGRGCRVQVGTDMLFEQIPAYLEFFDLPTTTAENLRALARLQY